MLCRYSAADKELFRYPFAIMTGEGGFTLTEAERENLRRYLAGEPLLNIVDMRAGY